MEKGKHLRQKFKIIEVYPVLILIVTLFISVGYARISDIEANIIGTVEAISQEGVFITDISNFSEDTSGSKINYFTGTMVDSEIVLENNSDSSITYQITLYNNSDKEYLFIDAITDKSDSTLYSNQNIEYSLNGIQEYITTIKPQDNLIFTITFEFKEGADISNNTLKSKMDFRFKEIPKILLSNEGQKYEINDIYPNCATKRYEFTVSNYDDTGVNNVPMNYYFEKNNISPVTVKIYDENGIEVTSGIRIDGNGIIKTSHKYTLEIKWNSTNFSEYENKEFNSIIKLKAIPEDTNYIEYMLVKQFSVNIETAPFYFNATTTNTELFIKNDVANLTMTINNYNSDTEYNIFDTNYEISIEGNDKFTFNIDGENATTRTISGGGKKTETLNLEFVGDLDSLDLTESLILKIISKEPYVKEISIPVTISFHKVTVTLDANGGTVSTSEMTVYRNKVYGDFPIPTWTGHVFNGWYSAKTGGTKYESTTQVTTDLSTQTLYAQWTSLLLADNVQIGDYVNYPVSYVNVYTKAAGTNIASDTIYTGWRVLYVEGSGNDKYVKLVPAGVPLAYRHAAIDTTSGGTSVTKLTTNFFSTAISTSSANYTFNACGFKNSSGGNITTISQLKQLFTNDYTQISNSTPQVKAMTKTDLEKSWGATVQNVTDLRGNDLLAIPTKDKTSEYAGYYLATANEGTYLWNSFTSGYIVYTFGYSGLRPVVSLKVSVETTGKTDGVWQLK